MLLEVNVTKSIGDFSLQAQFTLSEKRCGVFGPSGSGKSTLMHILAGLLKPDKGYITLNGSTLFDTENAINIPPQERRIGVVFQHTHLFPHLNVHRNLLYGWRRTKIEDRTISPESLIKSLSLAPLLNRAVSSLSGGERQRVALGRTVLACPRLLLMDEPLTGLDRELKFQIIPHLRDVLDTFDIPLLFISHSMQEICLMTEETLVFDDGRVQQHISTTDLARQDPAADSTNYINISN